MDKKITPNKEENTERHPLEKVPWSELSDVQKSQFLLGSKRLPDHESFVKEFKSWEAPSLD